MFQDISFQFILYHVFKNYSLKFKLYYTISNIYQIQTSAEHHLLTTMSTVHTKHSVLLERLPASIMNK